MLGTMGIRRRGGGGAVAVIEAVASNNSLSVVFGATPSNGELIVLIAMVANNNASTISGPGTFTNGPAYNQGGQRPGAVFWKVASSEASATYSCSASAGTVRVVGYRLSGANASPIGGDGTQYDATTGTTIAASSAAIDMNAGSLAIAAFSAANSIAGFAADNSFDNEILIPNSFMGTAYRLYPSADTAENSTATWTTTQTFRRGMLLEILPA